MPARIKSYRPPRVRGAKRIEYRPNAHERGYCDKRHKAWRLAVLTRDAWVCRDCGALASGRGEAHADHVIPVSVRPDLRYDIGNGQCLCVRCHCRKTKRESIAEKIA
jgi:5-methylcytosine-specific restriction endonuclease McrA